jgi:hypothetical protein
LILSLNTSSLTGVQKSRKKNVWGW